MDVYCPKCGDPVDNDYFHDYADDINSDYRTVARAFRSQGCEAIEMTCNASRDLDRSAVADAMYDLLGDDMDGVAAMMEDFGYDY